MPLLNMLLLSLAGNLWQYHDLLHYPSEKICAENWRIAESHHRAAFAHAELFGSWRNRQAVADAEMRMRFWWAAWWVVWPTATREQRECWNKRAREIIGVADWSVGYWPSPIP